MQTVSDVSVSRRYSVLNRLWVVTLAAGLAASVIDLFIATLATPVVHAPADYPSFTWFTILVGCLTGAIGGCAVFMVLLRFVKRPVLTFFIVSAGVLVASYGLPILPIVNPLPRFAGVNWGIAITLMFMHTLTAAIIVSSLVALRSRPKSSSRGETA